MSDLFSSAPSEPTPRGPVASEAWVPTVHGSQRVAPPTTIDGRDGFLLMAHPNRWGVTGGRVRPILGRMSLSPGISGVEQDRNGGVMAGRARLHYEERDWTLIPATTLPPSQAHRGSYLMRPKGRPDVTLCYWEQVFAGSAAIRCDETLRDEFLDYILSAGVIEPPPSYVLEALLDTETAHHAALLDRARTQPSAGPLADAARARVAAVETAIRDLYGSTAEATDLVRSDADPVLL